MRAARELGLPLTVLGSATNVLVSDEGLSGLVVLARNDGRTLNGELLTVEAGAELPGLVTDLAGQGLAGLEFAGNIPGSVGGAVVGNAGAYGRSVSDVLVHVHFLDGATEHVKPPRSSTSPIAPASSRRFPSSSCSPPPSSCGEASAAPCWRRSRATPTLRRSKHPLEYASCGSYFKNPSRELPAARLIEDAGLKGPRSGAPR